MLSELVLNMPFKTKIDTINLTNASIGYNETNDKTLMNGTVTFNDLKGRFTNFKNYDLTAEDSLKFKVSSTFMNTTTLRVNYAQSYLDSLSAFTMAVHVSPFDLTTLNPLLVPTVSARINDGYLDTLSMNAIGRKHVSWGVMKMYYHDLDFQYLNKGDEEHKSFKSRAVSLVASTIVNKRNTRGEGAVYAERVYDKGFTNYWLKILLSGVLTNTGIRTNKKQEKKYYQSIRKYQVPPIPDVTLD
jgi:hypothetical protein